MATFPSLIQSERSELGTSTRRKWTVALYYVINSHMKVLCPKERSFSQTERSLAPKWTVIRDRERSMRKSEYSTVNWLLNGYRCFLSFNMDGLESYERRAQNLLSIKVSDLIVECRRSININVVKVEGLEPIDWFQAYHMWHVICHIWPFDFIDDDHRMIVHFSSKDRSLADLSDRSLLSL